MNRLSMRIGKLEQKSEPLNPIQAVTYVIFAPSMDGGKRTGAMTRFLEVDFPELNQGEHQNADEHDAFVDDICGRIRELKMASEIKKEAGLSALSHEINNANKLQNKA